MGEFHLASLWLRLGFKFGLVGFELVILAFATKLIGEQYAPTEVLLLIGFLFYLLALMLMILLIWLSDQMESHNMLWITITMVSCFLAAICIVIGIALYGARFKIMPTYSTTFILAGAVMALLSGTWLAIELRHHTG